MEKVGLKRFTHEDLRKLAVELDKESPKGLGEKLLCFADDWRTSKDELLQIAGEPVAYLEPDAKYPMCCHSYEIDDEVKAAWGNLYTEAQLLAAYAKGAEDMRERAAQE